MPAVTFTYTGAPQDWTVPAGVTSVTIQCKGAAGGGFQNFNNVQTRGGRAKGTFAVTPGEVLHVFVGGAGTIVSISTTPGSGEHSIGGWNGGADSGLWFRFGWTGGGGGGASDVRRGAGGLADRIIVAGGGGGSKGDGGSSTQGGGLSGNPNTNPATGFGTGATQTGPGLGGSRTSGSGSDGSLGQGGTGGTQTVPDSFWGIAFAGGAGGGGGYYGGGGGAPGDINVDDGYPGGGGSGWVHPDAVNVEHELAGGSIGTSGGATSTGHGVVTIAWSIAAVNWADPIAQFGSNQLPRRPLLRVATGLWDDHFPSFWPQFNNIQIVWNGEYYLGIGFHGLIGKSHDLRRWTYTRLRGSAMVVQSIGWNGQYWCGVGEDYSINNFGGFLSTISEDGETWTLGSQSFFWPNMHLPNGVVWGNGVWVCADYVGNIFSSTDGLTWTVRVTKAQSDAFTGSVGDNIGLGIQWMNNGQQACIRFIPGKGFVALGRTRDTSNNGWPYYAFSASGTTWTLGRLKPNNSSLSRWDDTFQNVMLWLEASANEWIAIGPSANPDGLGTRPVVMRSTNGTSWQYVDPGPDPLWNSPSGVPSYSQVFWTGNVFIFGGPNFPSNPAPEMTSPNGLVWSAIPAHATPSPTRADTTLGWGNSQYVHVGHVTDEPHPWRIERWAGHPERARPADGLQPTGVRFICLEAVDYDKRNKDVIAYDKYSVGRTQNDPRWNPYHRFVRLDGKNGTTIANVQYSSSTLSSMGNGTFDAQGTGSLRLNNPFDFKVSPDGRYLFVLDGPSSSSATHLVRLDLQTGGATRVAGQPGNTGILAGYPDTSAIGRVSSGGMVGFHPEDGYLYMIGVYSTLNNVLVRLEDWASATPYLRVVADGAGLGGGLAPGDALSLRHGCFLGTTIYAIDFLRFGLRKIEPPYTNAINVHDEGSVHGNATSRFFDTPAHLTAMNKKLYICEGRGQIIEYDPLFPSRFTPIAGDGDNLNGVEPLEQWNDGDALAVSMAQCWSITTDGISNLYVTDGSGDTTTGMAQIHRVTQGGGVPPVRLRQRDDNPR